MNAAEHLERHLGKIDRGWSSTSLPGIQICAFGDIPTRGITTFATLGLSNTVLSMKQSRLVRQELLMSIPSDREPDEIVKLLLGVAERLLHGGSALLRGEIVHLGRRIAADCAAEALYASLPVVFPEGIATLADTDPATVFVWLFPLLPAEVAFAERAGWSGLEDRLEAEGPDLFDPCRDSIV